MILSFLYCFIRFVEVGVQEHSLHRFDVFPFGFTVGVAELGLNHVDFGVDVVEVMEDQRFDGHRKFGGAEFM